MKKSAYKIGDTIRYKPYNSDLENNIGRVISIVPETDELFILCLEGVAKGLTSYIPQERVVAISENKVVKKTTINMNNIELWHGDCLELMKNIPDGYVDCIVCDPPYPTISGGKPKPIKGQPSGMLSVNDGKVFKHNQLREEDWFPVIFDKLKEEGHCYIMTNTKNLERYLRLARETGFKLHNLLVWEKNTCTPNRWYMKNAEYTLFLRKGKARAINNKGSKTVHSFNNPRNKTHPTEKPVDLMEFYIQNSTNEGDTVLDFGMGTGATGISCAKSNRKFIGIEIDPNYFEIAKNRIEDHKQQNKDKL